MTIWKVTCYIGTMLTKRTNVLFDEDEYSRLVSIARVRKATVGHLIREAVKRTYVKKRKNVWAKTLSEIRKTMKGVKISPEEWKEFINEGRL